MKAEFYSYDIFPLVFPAGESVSFTLRPLDAKSPFTEAHRVFVQRLDSGSADIPFTSWNRTECSCRPDGAGCLHFEFTAASEGEHCVRIFINDKKQVQLGIYALDADLACRVPLRGDFHMHTCRSDGRESPAVVCANYRRRGYDFIVITDHGRYAPSLEAIDAYKNVRTALNILPGEEVHLPGTDVHIVNAGGLFSVNELPDTITKAQYDAEIDGIEADLRSGENPIPADINSRWYAVCLWAFDKIRAADGLGIFAHPYWISDMWQIPEKFTRYMLQNHPFDAFEVLGGENYYAQNGFQTALYYDEYRHGRVHPIVGSTDSHGSTEHNRNAAICSTVVFAPANERGSILNAVRQGYSVAVDTASSDIFPHLEDVRILPHRETISAPTVYRLVGEFRLQKYASFLMENYFPLHDRAAAVDGELMFQYINGNATAPELEAIAANAERLTKKYILTKPAEVANESRSL